MPLDFKQFLRRYETVVAIISNPDGTWSEDGKFAPGEEKTEIVRGAILPLSGDELQQAEGGAYTANDRKLYIHRRLVQGQEVEARGVRYLVRAEKDYSAYASGLRVYILARKGEAGA
ncbi:MAG: hypothetical protein PHP98_10500 [Kiritimatiellae bacterium]|nr:hypothetical protein [Kiritimatiellia bacterium]